MAKKKSHKKFSSLAENPFNIKVNRNKHSVLGQKVKGTKGKPVVSHGMSNTKRREEFHNKRKISQKANKFLDKRLLNSSDTYEDPATARLVQERKKKIRKSIFNLNDEETLTHKGLPLASGDSNELIGDSDEEELLDSQFVKQAHFGGFSETATKSRKEIIEEMIFESKKRKQERKLARENTADLIEKLDQEWKERHVKSLPMMRAGKNESSSKSDRNDPFDVLLNELKFEKRAAPAQRVKTPEEIMKEEEERLKMLEEERKKRMNPVESTEVTNYFSADSIYDGLDIQFDPVEDYKHDDANEFVKESAEDDDDDADNSSEGDEVDDDIVDDERQLKMVEDDSQSNIPDSLESFSNMVNEQDVYEKVDNLLKGVIKNKTKSNVKRLEIFFNILIEYVLKFVHRPKQALDILNKVLPHLYTVAEISPIHTANQLLSMLDKEVEYIESCKGKKRKKNFPKFSSLILFKLISKLYSVSDFQHPVVTPSVIFMCDILSSPYTFSYENTVARLFICQIIYDCVSYSKKYVPEVFFFIHKTLDLALNKNKKFNLHIDKEVLMQQKLDLKLTLPASSFNNEFKISILTQIFTILNDFAALYAELVSFKEIFSPFFKVCNQLPLDFYPEYLKQEISKFSNAVDSIKNVYKPLKFPTKKPVPLKLFEPNFESKFSVKKNDIQKKRKLVKSVSQKIKKEEKSLLREMRRETQVIASEKLKERIEADEDRKRKVKQLYGELAMQEGEYKKYMKKR